MFKPFKPSRRRLFVLSAVVPVLFTLLLAIYRPPFFSRLDDATYDVVVRSTPTRKPMGRVAIVDVDEKSLAAVGQWPWRRDVMGRLITALRASGAKLVAIDVIFAESDRYDMETGAQSAPAVTGPDQALAGVLRDNGVVLGYGLTFDAGGPSASRCVLHPIGVAIV
ncbi:MAG TPA: CHASE2 domain-containing protein, partial [Vicinamibacterales bacterium]|nr:CHASE2 domain-containing protein [Vicinamibacterales bacterium]